MLPAAGSFWRNTKLDSFTYEVKSVNHSFVRGIARWQVRGQKTFHSFTIKNGNWLERVATGELVPVASLPTADE